VASPVLNESEIEWSQTFMLKDFHAGPVWAPSVSEASAFAKETDGLSESNAEDGDCLKGFFVAIGIEAAMAFCLYGVWQAWHIFR
jgi:hypothetical protein